MATHDDTQSPGENEQLFFNGIDAATGSYLFEPMTTAELARVATGQPVESKDTLTELKFRHDHKDEAHFGVKEGIDPFRRSWTSRYSLRSDSGATRRRPTAAGPSP